MALFEGYERRIDKINGVLREYGLENIEQAKTVCEQHGINVDSIVKGIQPIAFENAVWAYTLGCAIALKKGAKTAADAAADIGIGLQAFCISGSVADQRQVGLGHGNLGKMLLSEETECFAFLAGHESFAAAEGAIGIARRQQSTQKASPRHSQRSRKGRGVHHLPYKRLYLRADKVRLLHGRTENRKRNSVFQRRKGKGSLLRRGRRKRGRGNHAA